MGIIEEEETEEESEEELTDAELQELAKNEFKTTLLTDSEIIKPETQDDQANDQAANPIVDEILKISENSIRDSEVDASDSNYLSEITSSIVEASEQAAQVNDEESESVEIESTPEVQEEEIELGQSDKDISLEVSNQVVNTILDLGNVVDQEYSADDLYEVINSLVVDEEQGQIIEEVEKELEKIEQEIDSSIKDTETIDISIPNTQNTNSTLKFNILTNNSTISLNNTQAQPTPTQEQIETILTESEQNLLNSNVVEKIVNSMVVEVPEELINSVANARAKNTTNIVMGEDLSEEDNFMNSMVETVLNMFSS